MNQNIEGLTTFSKISPALSKDTSGHELPGVNILLATDFTEPEGSDERYTATVVPKIQSAEGLTNDRDIFYFRVGGKIAVAFLTEAEATPILQVMDETSRSAASEEDAINQASAEWYSHQQLQAHDGSILYLQ